MTTTATTVVAHYAPTADAAVPFARVADPATPGAITLPVRPFLACPLCCAMARDAGPWFALLGGDADGWCVAPFTHSPLG